VRCNFHIIYPDLCNETFSRNVKISISSPCMLGITVDRSGSASGIDRLITIFMKVLSFTSKLKHVHNFTSPLSLRAHECHSLLSTYAPYVRKEKTESRNKIDWIFYSLFVCARGLVQMGQWNLDRRLTVIVCNGFWQRLMFRELDVLPFSPHSFAWFSFDIFHLHLLS
jgi:hypothetical protein